MALLKTAWANLQDGLGNRFSWSHVKAIFYNYAEHKLLSTKLDEMDALIDAKIAKAMMSSVQVNDESKVPTSALAYSMSQEISQNEQNIAQLNSNLWYTASDLNNLPNEVRFFKYPTNTPNAPSLSAGVGIRMYYDTNFSAQIAAGYGEDPKFRASVNGEFRAWKSFTMSS